MKSRSHRPPVSEPRHDDWVDGSWTVDCICGVNFDDGEEMVDCDECGVWVHTRCSRYVKSEKSFACDKCKNKNIVSGGGASSGVRNDSEEAEVAEFLVELPTKTMLDTPNPASVSSRRPFRLWTNISMEERVHVQGVPGGESGFFSGSKMSSIFGPQLWEATGYVPKKSNFQYTEFPWFDNGKAEGKKEEEMDKNSEEISKQANNGAGVLLSLSEEKKFPTKVVYPRVVKYPVEGTVPREILSPKQDKKFGGKNLDSSCPKAILLNPGKRKKEPITLLKCQNEKKKLRTLEKEGETEVQAVQDSKAASSDAKYSFCRDIGSEAASSNDLQSCKDGLSVHLSDGLGECTTNLASNEHFLDPTLRNNVSAHEISRTENIRHEMHLASKNFSKVSNDLELLTNLAESMTVKSEVPGDCGHAGGDVGGATGSVGIGPLDKEPLTGDLVIPKAEINEDNPEIDVAIIRPNKKLKGELVDDGIKHTRVEPLSLEAVNLNSMKATTRCPVSCANGLFGGKVSDAPAMSSELNDSKLLDTSKSLIVDHPRTDKYDASPDNLYATKEEPIVSDFSLGTRKISSELEHASELGEELVKSNGTVRSHSTNLYDHKVVVALAKPSSTSGGMVKSFDNRVAANAKNLSVQSRHKELPEGNMGNRKQNVLADTVGHDGKCGRTRKFVKELSRSSSLSKTSDSTKFSHMSDSKRLSSDSKDFNVPSSSKVSSMPNATTVRFSGEGVSPQVEAAPNARNKDVALAEPGKGEKSCQTGTQPSLRGTVTSTASASSNVPAALSDEELALLLHQELNSSPRVPRVSRMRHAGSLPQLTCPSAASMLVKRTSSGGKDQNVTSRKKSKDLSGEGPCGDLVASREAKKMERKPSSLDDRRRDSGCSTYQLSKKEGECGPVKSVQYVKKASGSSCLSSDANGHSALASCPPARNASEDDPRMVGCQEHHTLPGLIAEIMSEGKRMTYEDLCNAVLPHWPHLRKHNGERYAYSSHSQAVLDCLRNRSEWARLVDRGPKTSASRKGRKLDADSLSIESEENEDSITKNAKDVVSRSFESHQDDFPKGKRKARKRRRLALQGRGIVRRRRADIVSDEDSESFSNSVGDSMSSEEEIQGDGTSAVGSDASTSSDDGR